MLGKWCEITSCNGVIDLYQSRKSCAAFLFWLLVMGIMCGAATFFTYKAVDNYINKPYATNIETVPNVTLKVPEFMFCFNGGFNVKEMSKAGLSTNLIKVFPSVTWSSGNVNKYNQSAKDSAKAEFAKYMEEHNATTNYMYSHFGYECADIVTYARIRGQANPCKSAVRVPRQNGDCFALKNKGFTSPAPYGDSIITFTAPNTSFASIYPDDAFDIGLNDEFLITIEETLGYEQSQNPLNVPINTYCKIILNPKLYKRIPYGNRCETNRTLYPTSNTCNYQCVWKEFVKQCGCELIDYPNYYKPYSNNSVTADENNTYCNPFKYSASCKAILTKNIDTCQSQCLPICEEWVYETTVVYSSINMYSRRKSNVKIIYKSFMYIKIEEIEAFTYDIAIANIGGQAGLWLGMSVITIIEAIYFILLAMITKKQVETLPNKAKNASVSQISYVMN